MEAFGKFCAGLLAFSAICAIGVLLAVFRAHVLMDLWAWFMVPYGLRQIPFITALGINLILWLTLSWVKPSDPAEKTEGGFWKKGILRLFVSTMIILWIWGFGALYHAMFH